MPLRVFCDFSLGILPLFVRRQGELTPMLSLLKCFDFRLLTYSANERYSIFHVCHSSKI